MSVNVAGEDGVWNVCDVLDAVGDVCIHGGIMWGCGVSGGYVYVCHHDVFGAV